MLTFECCLQQLLGLCIKRLDFILLSTRLPHDDPAQLLFAGAGLVTAPGEERGRGGLRCGAWSWGSQDAGPE